MEVNGHNNIQLLLSSFNGLYNVKNYNNFFHPNVCHVCKTTMQSRLQMCTGCYMISYCSEDHKMLHRQQHADICQVISKINANYNLRESRYMRSDEWTLFKRDNVERMKLALGRNLQLYEEQMFLFAKSCFICRQQTDLVSTCGWCCSINSCATHILSSITHECENLRVSLILDIEYLIKEQDMKQVRFCANICINDICSNTMSFVQRFAKENALSLWQSFDYYYSDWVSVPLTVCHVMIDPKYCSLLKKSGTFVVHIIAGSSMDVHSLLAWEIFLHLLCAKTTLKITMIEPNLENRYRLISDICTSCRSFEKMLYAEYHNLSYGDYIHYWQYEKPDVIVGYNAELKKFATQTIQILGCQKCPLILTTTSDNETTNFTEKLKEVLSARELYIISTKNKYQSVRPYRSYRNDSTFYLNENLIIYDSLNPLY